MTKSARRFPAIYLAALLVPLLSARAEDRTTARAPLPPPLPAPSTETQPGPQAETPAPKPSIRFDEPSAVKPPPATVDQGGASVGDQGRDALPQKQSTQDKPKQGALPSKKEAQSARREHQRRPAGTGASATTTSPPQQLSPPIPEYDARREPGDIASADRETTAPTSEDPQTRGMGRVPYPSYRSQFGYPWPFASPPAGGLPPYPPFPLSPPYRAEGYYPDFPAPPYSSNATPYRYP
jgi:hypothetical protein